MFRSRKAALVKQAWKSRRTGPSDLPEHKQTDVNRKVKVAAQYLLKSLSEPQLELFVGALDSRGGDPGQCVLVRPDLCPEWQSLDLPPHRLVLWVWRWPELPPDVPLRCLPTCHARNDHVYVCANPYHWALLLDTGTARHLAFIQSIQS